MPSGSSGTGSSAVDSGSAAIGSAGLNQTSSVGGTFADCDAARAAGRAPLFRGEPGYSPNLDPDNTREGLPNGLTRTRVECVARPKHRSRQALARHQ
jgi:hypothetical protein